MKLWETENTDTEDIVEKYTANEDVELDRELVQDDILGNIAHTQMLYEQGYLTERELGSIHSSLLEIYDLEVEITSEDEDVHSKIESLVTEKTEAGKKIHTGRSRNDQVLLDTRLYAKRNIISIAHSILELVEVLISKSEDNQDLLMPGYTHMRQAMPMTAYLWLTSYAESLLDDLKFLKSAFDLCDQNPLGAAAGYGTSLKIDRDRTTDLLKFSKKQNNPIYCVNTRGKIELEIISALSQIMLDINRLSNDLILFSTHEYNFIDLPDKFCTGSSIMPQKSNPDVLEIIKGRTANVLSYQDQIELILKNSNLGYNRDTQETKKPFMESIRTTKESSIILRKMIPEIEFNQKQIKENTKESIYSAYTANKKVENGKTFRESYKEVKKEKNYKKPEIDEINNYKFNYKELKEMKTQWDHERTEYSQMVQNLLSLARKNSEDNESS